MVLWVQLDGPGLKGNCQETKWRLLIVQSTVAFLWRLFSPASVVCFVKKTTQGEQDADGLQGRGWPVRAVF